MVHDARIIRIERQARADRASASGWAIRSAGGKATRWSSRRRTSPTRRGMRGSTPNLKVTERFSRARREDAAVPLHDRAIRPPSTQPWSGEYPVAAGGRAALRVRVPRRQLRDGQHPSRGAAAREGSRRRRSAAEEVTVTWLTGHGRSSGFSRTSLPHHVYLYASNSRTGRTSTLRLARRRNLARQSECLVEVARLDQIEAGAAAPSVSAKGPSVTRQPSVAHADRRRGVDRLQRLGRDDSTPFCPESVAARLALAVGDGARSLPSSSRHTRGSAFVGAPTTRTVYADIR